MEKFCCRFKTTEVANSFREAFMKAKAIAKAKEDSGAGSEQVGVWEAYGGGDRGVKGAIRSWKIILFLLTTTTLAHVHAHARFHTQIENNR